MEMTSGHRMAAFAMWLTLLAGFGLVCSLLHGWWYVAILPLFAVQVAVGTGLLRTAMRKS